MPLPLKQHEVKLARSLAIAAARTMRFQTLVCAASLLALSGCTALENDLQKGFRYGTESQQLIGKADRDRKLSNAPNGVNAYLWRAAMDSVGFLPLETADPRLGQIITKWYTTPTEFGTRSRVAVEILDPDLRRDTIRVTVWRQVQSADGAWMESPTPSGTAQSLEDSIYTKARDISPY
jgi:hypothetical protein